jgi:hypothetical protein
MNAMLLRNNHGHVSATWVAETCVGDYYAIKLLS